MGTQTLITASVQQTRNQEGRHRLRWRLAALAACALIGAVLFFGFSYYAAPLAERVRSPLHQLLRPSGTIGLRLGMLGAVLFCLIYLYPIRKRWRWLRSIGNTKHWLDFHILMGVVGPLLISLHSSFRFEGIAGMAFWIMWTVVASGVAGKYLYAQIPRHLSAAEMTLDEIGNAEDEIAAKLQGRTQLTGHELNEIFAVPSAAEVRQMPVVKALFTMLWIDLSRPARIAELRRRSIGMRHRLTSLGGLLPCGDADLEARITLIRKRAWLSTKVAFLDKVQGLFHLWHVIHRPFSYSFAVLVVLHVCFVILLGYF